MNDIVAAPLSTKRPVIESTFRTHDGVALFYRHWPATQRPVRGALVFFHRFGFPLNPAAAQEWQQQLQQSGPFGFRRINCSLRWLQAEQPYADLIPIGLPSAKPKRRDDTTVL